MKRTIVLFCILLSCCLITNAQKEKDTATAFVNKYNQMVIENEKFKTENEKFKTENAKLKKELDDSVKRLQKAETKVNELEKKNGELSNVKKQRDSIRRVYEKLTPAIIIKTDSISILTEKIQTLNGQIATNQRNYDSTIQQKESEFQGTLQEEKNKATETGRNEIRTQIEKGYKQDFEKLIAASSLESVKRDLAIVKNDEVKSTLQQLQSYFEIKASLEQKFDEKMNNANMENLNKMPQTASVKKLKETLKKYPEYVTKLKECLSNVMKIDKEFIEMQDFKMSKILPLFSAYINDTTFDGEQYPYLSKIIYKVIRLKQIDADSDIKKQYDSL